jgi:NAD(P)-dependent dehydrogenase (short-subunit alcohol dehydrogenase family)
MNRLEGKVALISGAAKGQGAEEVALFAAEDAQVIFGDILDDLSLEVEKKYVRWSKYQIYAFGCN